MKNQAREQAAAQLASVRTMVAALECDFDRLEELRETKQALRGEFDAIPENEGCDFDNWARNQTEMTSEEFDELAELEAAAGDCADYDDARQRIEEDALSVEVRSGWHTPGDQDAAPEEYRIVLCCGGPHVEIVGDLNQYGEPESARLMYQDWGTGKQEHITDEQADLLAYASVFYFGN